MKKVLFWDSKKEEGNSLTRMRKKKLFNKDLEKILAVESKH